MAGKQPTHVLLLLPLRDGPSGLVADAWMNADGSIDLVPRLGTRMRWKGEPVTISAVQASERSENGST